MVPALSRGLQLLEAIAATGAGLTFSGILQAVDAPRASGARLLACLRDEGWVEQGADGHYRAAARTRLLGAPTGLRQRLADVGAPLVCELADRLEMSALLISIEGQRFVCVASHIVENSIALQSPGTVRDDFSGGPWGSIAYAQLDEGGRAKARQRMEDAAAFEQQFPSELQQLKRAGYICDEGAKRRGASRIGVPVEVGGTVIAVLGLGAFPAQLEGAQRRSAVTALQNTAAQLAHQIPATALAS